MSHGGTKDNSSKRHDKFNKPEDLRIAPQDADNYGGKDATKYIEDAKAQNPRELPDGECSPYNKR